MSKWIFWFGALLVAAPLYADETTSSAVQMSTAALVPSSSSSTVVSRPVLSSSSSIPSPVKAPTPVTPPAAVSLPGVMPRAPRSFLNEMVGTVLATDNDAGTIRITVEGGFNVDFSYDDATTVTEDSKPLTPADLSYGDKIVIHYAGKDLLARQIERTAKASTDAH